MIEEMPVLTLEDAIKQGYEKFIYTGDGFQALQDLSDVDDEDFARGIELVSKDPFTVTVSKETIAELIAEDTEVNHVDNTSDDTQQVYNAIKALDFTDTAKMINDALSSIHYYRSSGIKLVKE